ncbi:hypothetical protein RJT34_17480 [Clitoria ternatea]|uniref:TIP41-like protein n=1 Tax=Clitoria ternatea TaxID=43366 RepID=A0AAN9PDT9_CLITE
MAENLVDGEFWLPPQFLSDDDSTATPFNSKSLPLKVNIGDDAVLFPSEFPFHGFTPSELGSGSGSGGSSETESDEDDQLVAELTRRFARSSLYPDGKSSENHMGRFVSGSPQSTLCAIGNGCGCRKGSSQGSPNGVCDLTSSKATWDLLHAAAGEVERMRLNKEGDGFTFNHQNHNNGFFVPQRKPSPVTPLPSKNSNPTITNSDAGLFTQQSLCHQQLQIAQFQMLRQQQIAKQQGAVWNLQKQCGGVYQQRQNNQVAPNRGRVNDVNGVVGGRNPRPVGLSPSAWPTLQHAKQQQNQQQYGSGMRAVFLGNPSGRRECAGTGVFLPRRIDSPAESRKKPACSTVLVPTRVAQALNLNLDDMMGGQPQHLQQQHRFGASNMDSAAVSRLRSNNNYVLSQQKRNLKAQPTVNHDIKLPQEWTY